MPYPCQKLPNLSAGSPLTSFSFVLFSYSFRQEPSFLLPFHLQLGDHSMADRATKLQSNLAVLAPFFLSAKSTIYRLEVLN